jgi:hypothetical protein
LEESSRAIKVEEEILSAFSEEIDARTSADELEKSERLSSDNALQSQINSIISNSDPQSIIMLTKILEEFKAADLNLEGAIKSLYQAATSKLKEEVDERLESDNELKDLIESEMKERIDSITELEQILMKYADSVALKGGSKPKKEFVTINKDKIKLTYAPISGLDGVGNFGLVRHFDDSIEDELVVHDAEIELDTSDETGKTFIIKDLGDKWDTKSVLIQYQYCPEL